jgi:hypothetical protein
MIQPRPATTDLARVGPMAAIVLAAGLSVGFVAGQAAPDLVGSLFGPSAAVTTSATVLPQNVDYGIRHIGVTQPLGQSDDYGIRHLTAPTLTEVDDYGTRHSTTTPLTPADDYGTRHP